MVGGKPSTTESYHLTESRNMKVRRIVAAVGLALLLGCQAGPNGSTDGRYHTCGYVTDVGVTEHLADYQTRCGT